MKYILLLFALVGSWVGIGQITLTLDSAIVIEGPHNEGSSSNLYPPYPTPPDTTVPKLTFWVHGLAGNAHSWNRVQASTENQTGNSVQGYPERHTEGLSVDYSGHENLRIFQLASFVNNNLMESWRVAVPRRDTLPVSDNFVISHSQGGIVSRAMRHNNLNNSTYNPSQFGALVTFNTPNGGAYIINSTRPSNGDVQAWIEHGCSKLTAAKLTEIKNSKWWLDFLLSSSAVQNFAQTACSGLNGTVLPILVDAIRKPVGQDYADNAPGLAILKNTAQQDTMKVVTVAGIEEEPVFWRVIHTMTFTTDTSLSGSTLFNDPFGYNDDDEMPQFINSLVNHYRSKEANNRYLFDNYWRLMASGYGWFLTQSRYEYNNDANMYKHAHQFLGTANMQWKRFIGARRDTIAQNGTYTCFCTHQRPYRVYDPGDCGTPYTSICYVVPNFDQTIIEEPNDGVVTYSSQIDYPGRTTEIMYDTNHMQARNCEETKKQLNELFNGKHGEEYRLFRK